VAPHAVVTLVGDESYYRDRYRAELAARIPESERDYAWFDEDLASTPLDDILDRARTPSLMAPLQVFYVRGVKELFGRGEKKHGKFPGNVEAFAAQSASPPTAALVFVADHLHLPADRQRMSLEDKSRLQRIEATLGACGPIIECARPAAAQAVAIARQLASDRHCELAPEAARQLVELLDGNLGLISVEIEKLCLHALPGKAIGQEAIASLVAGSRIGSAYELVAAMAKAERARCLAALGRVWADEGEAGAIGLVFQLSRAVQMALILKQERVSDRNGIYRALPEGLRPPGFAADTILALARSMPLAKLQQALQLLHAADVKLRSTPPSPRLVFEQVVLALT
jgi:DNA polymerase-3 subunit delta